MNMNYSNRTKMYESIFAQIYIFLVLFTILAFYHEKSFKPKLQKIFFYQKYVLLGQNTLIYCSQGIVDHIYVNAFL